MARFILRRILLSIVTLLLLSFIVFVCAQVLPGDVARNILGPFADQKSVDALNAKLGTDQPLTPFVHFYSRDTEERYVVVAYNGRLHVYNLAGVEFPISTTLYETAYLDCDTPSEDLAAMTLADTSFIVNRTVTAAMLPDVTTDAALQSDAE